MVDNLTKSIVDVKISDYDLIYALIFVEEAQSYELQGFTLNGTYFGKHCGNISDFQISESGKIIVGDLNKPTLEVLNPVDFTQLYYKMFPIKGDNKYYHFLYDRPNVIYFGVKDNGDVIGQEIGKETLRDISKAIRSRIKPECAFEVNKKTSDDVKIFIEVCFGGDRVPYSADGKYFLRFSDEDKQMTNQELDKFFQDLRKDYSSWEKDD